VAQVEEKRRPPLILDVAAGSGRLTLAVQLSELLPDARWVLLDASRRMLAQARKRLKPTDRLHFIQHSAQNLPFEDDFFDVVTCMEALEFLPAPVAALAELVRYTLNESEIIQIIGRARGVDRKAAGPVELIVLEIG